MINWLTLSAVFIGGGIGATLRFLLTTWLNPPAGQMPWGTLTVNLLGCALIGYVGVWLTQQSLPDWLRPILVVGGLGALTTWSSFAFEGLFLWQNQQTRLAMLYVLLTFSGCFTAVSAGYWFAKKMLA